MFKVVSLWNLRPGVSPEEAEKQYYEEHIPIAKKIPGLRKYIIGKGRGKDHPFYRIAELYFDDKDAMSAGFASPEGKATIEDNGFTSRIKDRIVVYYDEEEVKL
ncbi:MAG: EthD family reductase [Dehalococcoidales bacterium]|nr:EthD family reductase [Dehalococcoidales bacterium]